MGVAEEQVGYLSKATLGNIHVSPQKARLVVDLVRGKKLDRALDLLTNTRKKTAPLLHKLLLSAAANAKERSGADVDELYVKSAWVDSGQTLHRFMPRAQGRATPIRKRYSRITVLLDEQP